jgi:hypothetical protein
LLGALKSKLINEWKQPPATTKMFKDLTLNDQTSWFALDKLKLFKDEIEAVRELLDIEPDSACKYNTIKVKKKKKKVIKSLHRL